MSLICLSAQQKGGVRFMQQNFYFKNSKHECNLWHLLENQIHMWSLRNSQEFFLYGFGTYN